MHFKKSADDRSEEGGDDVKSLWSLRVGLHTCYNGDYNKRQSFKWEQIYKNHLNSDYGLKLAHMKLESLVIAEQHAAVNMFLGFVHTARHILGVIFF